MPTTVRGGRLYGQMVLARPLLWRTTSAHNAQPLMLVPMGMLVGMPVAALLVALTTGTITALLMPPTRP